jgi:hypothetical protein
MHSELRKSGGRCRDQPFVARSHTRTVLGMVAAGEEVFSESVGDCECFQPHWRGQRGHSAIDIVVGGGSNASAAELAKHVRSAGDPKLQYGVGDAD